MGLFDFFRKRKPELKTDALQPTQHCFVLCEAAEFEDLSHADECIAQVFGPGHSADLGDGKVISVTRGEDAIGFLLHLPMPIPEQEAEENADHNILWPNGRSEAAEHRSHVVVVNAASGDQTPVQSAIAVSRLALAALKVFDGIGVYWGNASVCNSRQVFETFCENISEKHLPVPLWLRFQFVRQSVDNLGMYTLGMSQFGLMEIETDRCKMEPQDLLDFVSNVAHYLIQSGPVISDGNTVGGSENERILVRHRPSMIDENRQVYKIVFEE